jgi:hypothetical protein
MSGSGGQSEGVLAGFMQSDRKRADLSLLHGLLHVIFTSYLANDLHVKMDRMSMAKTLETPSPMLNTTLMGYLPLLPPALKIRCSGQKYI